MIDGASRSDFGPFYLNLISYSQPPEPPPVPLLNTTTTYTLENQTFISVTTTTTTMSSTSVDPSFTTSTPGPFTCPWTCELTNDAGYVVYSALGSFYIPMFVMLFFYWRIYRAAVRTTRAINQGFKTTKGESLYSDSDLALAALLVMCLICCKFSNLTYTQGSRLISTGMFSNHSQEHPLIHGPKYLTCHITIIYWKLIHDF